MEKRLPLFLFLSFGILFGWQMLFPPPAKPEVTPRDGAGTNEQAEGQDSASGARVSAAVPADVLQGEPWSESLILGRAGELGHYSVRFDSLGGTVSELSVDGWYDSGLLDTEQQREVAHWVSLLRPMDLGAGPVGSLLMETSASSAVHFPGGLSKVHWAHEWILSRNEKVGVRFSHQPKADGYKLIKEIRSVPGDLHLEVLLRIEAPVGSEELRAHTALFRLIPAVGLSESSEDQWYISPKARKGYETADGLEVDWEERRDGPALDDLEGDLPSGSQTAFVGVDNKYFAVLLRAADSVSRETLKGTRWRRVFDQGWLDDHPGEESKAWRGMLVDQELALAMPGRGAAKEYHFELFAGPKDESLMLADEEAYAALTVADLGFFDGIAGLLLTVLSALEGLVGNWGAAIILLTLLVRGVLFPINRRSQTAMAQHTTKMKRVQPKLNAVKEQYKDNPQKLRQEQAKIMQDEGAFPPLGGCLPMFLQIPVFFGLFSALRVSFDLRQASFLWVEDLSMPDRLLRIDFNTHLPFIGTIEYLNVLPPLMVVLWILQQRLMPKPTDEQAARMQKMMMWMPVLFGVFLYNYAGGLSLYMITSSLFGIAEYTIVRKIWPIDDTEKARKPGKFMKRMKEMQEQQARMQKQQQASKKSGGGRKKRR
ncbi:MAG TPA: membrane protein insertase YidC [Planctomycetes bacterium]|nr:membrane protein insertase YidC [Planctomycetota bacterium]HIL37599.1 membrane protein insertase YidC [Planctomycetota bacterium]